MDRATDSGITAFVLAGGKSARMGTDKAFLQLGRGTLLTRALELAGGVARDVWIGGDAQKFAAFGRVVEDVYHDSGPLGGIHAALSRTTNDLNLMLAVDLPFVELKFLHYLIARAAVEGAVVTVPRTAGGLQPLCAIYRRAFVEVAERSLREGQNKIDALFSAVETRVIAEEELARQGFSEEMFRNLNTPQELRQAELNHPPTSVKARSGHRGD